MSKRQTRADRTEILLGVAFFVSAGITYANTDAGSTLMVLYGALATAVGYTGGKHITSEGERPSGTIPDDAVPTGMYDVDDER